MAARTRASSAARGGRPSRDPAASASRSMALVPSPPDTAARAVRRGLAVGGRGGQPVLLGLEPGVLVGVLDAGPLDLADLVPEEVDLPGPGPGVTAEGLGLVGEAPEPQAGGPSTRSRSIWPKASRARRWASVWTRDWCWC